MAALQVTKETGGKTRLAEMTTAAPPQLIGPAELMRIGAGIGVDGLFLADMISAFAAHERASVELGIAAARQSAAEDLAQLHEAMAGEHRAHAEVYAELMEQIGLDPMYVSPSARMAQFQGNKRLETALLRGSVDARAMDLALLDEALLAEGLCAENRLMVRELAGRMPASNLRRAFEQAARRFAARGEGVFHLALATRRSLLIGGVLPRATR